MKLAYSYSNLPYISKVIEPVVASQLNVHLTANLLNETNQSAYRQYHSTETALTCVLNDILLALDRKESVFLILLDLSAAFDTVDHQLLLTRLATRVGVDSVPLEWIKSYLLGRTQYVSVAGEGSECHQLTSGVPQGSVLGPIFFTIYTQPLGDIVRSHNMDFHLYADDTQLYLTFDGRDLDSERSSRERMEACISDVKQWMLNNKLKLNDSKTEFLTFTPSIHRQVRNDSAMRIGDDMISCSKTAKNLGVLLDDQMSLADHITAICKSANFQLFRLSRIRKYLTPEALRIAVHALISARIDYCNSVLVGLPQSSISRLQHIMNCAARLVTGAGKFDHITPVLKSLHWLPVSFRIQFKILCMVFKTLNGQAPDYLCKAVTQYIPKRALRSSDQRLLVVPKVRTKKYGERAFSFAAPHLYNSLPEKIRMANTIDTFKANLKTHLFRLAYETA